MAGARRPASHRDSDAQRPASIGIPMDAARRTCCVAGPRRSASHSFSISESPVSRLQQSPPPRWSAMGIANPANHAFPAPAARLQNRSGSSPTPDTRPCRARATWTRCVALWQGRIGLPHSLSLGFFGRIVGLRTGSFRQNCWAAGTSRFVPSGPACQVGQPARPDSGPPARPGSESAPLTAGVAGC